MTRVITFNSQRAILRKLRNRWDDYLHMVRSMNLVVPHIYREENHVVNKVANLGLDITDRLWFDSWHIVFKSDFVRNWFGSPNYFFIYFYNTLRNVCLFSYPLFSSPLLGFPLLVGKKNGWINRKIAGVRKRPSFSRLAPPKYRCKKILMNRCLLRKIKLENYDENKIWSKESKNESYQNLSAK
jgi:hypothetical protein